MFVGPPASDLAQVKKGQPVSVQLPYVPGQRFQGRVDYVYPTLDGVTRTGRVRVAVSVTIGVALAAYLVNSIAILNDTVEALAALTPFDYYLTSEPLTNGMHWGNAAVLTGAFVAMVAIAVVLFDRRDLRQIG